MNNLSALLATLLFFPLASPAQTPADGASELKALQDQHTLQVRERVIDPYDKALADLNTGYLRRLEQDLAKAKSSGDLVVALSLESEMKLIKAEEELPANDEQASKPLKKLRVAYRAELAKLSARRDANLATALAPHVKKLKQLEADLTKADRLADARSVMEYRLRLEESKGVAVDPANATLEEILMASDWVPTKIVGREVNEKEKSGIMYFISPTEFQCGSKRHSVKKIDEKTFIIFWAGIGGDGHRCVLSDDRRSFVESKEKTWSPLKKKK